MKNHSTHSTLSLWTFAAIACLSSPHLLTAENFPASYQIEDSLSEKRGEYRYVYRLFFELYDAAFFAVQSAQNEDILNAEVPFHLSFRYLRTIDKSIIIESADKMLARNLSPTELKSIAERVDKINAAYTTVEDGDRSSLTYIPSVGTILKINGMPVATIVGQDFAKLYFQIWLGENPISAAMKAVLFGE